LKKPFLGKKCFPQGFSKLPGVIKVPNPWVPPFLKNLGSAQIILFWPIQKGTGFGKPIKKREIGRKRKYPKSKVRENHPQLRI